ncbi:hypothetical protein HBI56_216910 [Parastagonospora nodorum]|nr:hypothetical protein HBH53_000260 [Parastagonospora nodorum]KAH4007562.1 hypothetical protein HBI10_009740 [Parastagonospora nodorum]KAH4023670.1 hypothetical protein HBI13_091450 [Parastagonospora nodorum]KAH4102596.1 hypothetical protein HBH46_126360 [Parastagonospora nodorum]KAH4178256.1 hypothetical protein HBH43_042460 [Parastagonospora nodorum]
MSGRRVEHLKIPAVRSKCHHHNRQRRVVVERMVSVEAGFRRDAARPGISPVVVPSQLPEGAWARPPHIPFSMMRNCILAKMT